MKIFLAKAVIAAAIASGVSAETLSAAGRVSFAASWSQRSVQDELFGAHDLFRSVLDYLITPVIDLKPVDERNDECHPKAIRNKEAGVKCGYKY